MKFYLSLSFKLILQLVQVLLISSIFQASYAAENIVAIEQNLDPLSPEQIENLIVLLESDTAREQFLNNLRTLIAADSNDEGFSFSISEIFDIDETSEGVVSNYLKFLDGLGISDSTVGKVVVFFLLLCLIAIMVFVNNRLANTFDKKLNVLRKKFRLPEHRFRPIFSGQRITGYLVGAFFIISALSFVFDLIPGSERSLITSLTEYMIVGLLICLFVIIAWEAVNAVMEYGMNENSSLNTVRIRTLLPVVKNLAFFVILLLAGLVVLSELGIDIVPLLAGAGVIGIAIGFGAQTMVKDFLSGFIIVLEDLVQVGDVIGVGGRTGTVEEITLRKIQLRNLDGTVHTVPHSEISVVDNLTKEYSYYLMEINVAYKEDTDEVIKCLKLIDKDLRECEEFSNKILEPLEILGVDEFADSAVIIKVRTKTNPHDKWTVGREFNRRIKKAFDKQGIEIPFPHQTVYFGNGIAVDDKRKLPTDSK